MAPTVTHPTSVTFLDDHIHRPVNVDAAAYYGANESYSRSRTYSHVSVSFLALPTSANNFLPLMRSHTYMDITLGERPHLRRTYTRVPVVCPTTRSP